MVARAITPLLFGRWAIFVHAHLRRTDAHVIPNGSSATRGTSEFDNRNWHRGRSNSSVHLPRDDAGQRLKILPPARGARLHARLEISDAELRVVRVAHRHDRREFVQDRVGGPHGRWLMRVHVVAALIQTACLRMGPPAARRATFSESL